MTDARPGAISYRTEMYVYNKIIMYRKNWVYKINPFKILPVVASPRRSFRIVYYFLKFFCWYPFNVYDCNIIWLELWYVYVTIHFCTTVVLSLPKKIIDFLLALFFPFIHKKEIISHVFFVCPHEYRSFFFFCSAKELFIFK